MTDLQHSAAFQTRYVAEMKNPTTGIVLALFLGGLGAHRFYMGQVGLGILYAVFVWSLVPAVLGLVEAFLMKGRVAAYNEQLKSRLAAEFGQAK